MISSLKSKLNNCFHCTNSLFGSIYFFLFFFFLLFLEIWFVSILCITVCENMVYTFEFRSNVIRRFYCLHTTIIFFFWFFRLFVVQIFAHCDIEKNVCIWRVGKNSQTTKFLTSIRFVQNRKIVHTDDEKSSI